MKAGRQTSCIPVFVQPSPQQPAGRKSSKGRIDKVWPLHTMESCSAIQRNEVATQATRHRSLETLMLL